MLRQLATQFPTKIEVEIWFPPATSRHPAAIAAELRQEVVLEKNWRRSSANGYRSRPKSGWRYAQPTGNYQPASFGSWCATDALLTSRTILQLTTDSSPSYHRILQLLLLRVEVFHNHASMLVHVTVSSTAPSLITANYILWVFSSIYFDITKKFAQFLSKNHNVLTLFSRKFAVSNSC